MAETQTYEPRLKSEYRATIRPALREKFGYSTEMQIPRLDKIVVNIDRKSTRLNSSHLARSRMPSSA